MSLERRRRVTARNDLQFCSIFL